MQYKTLSAREISKLDDLVNQYLKEGWKLNGSQYFTNFEYLQPVTKGDYIRPARLKDKAK